MKLSELLVFRDGISATDVQKIEDFAHKWGVTNKLRVVTPTPLATFADPIGAVDMTLFWGTNDGGTNPTLWENEVNLGRYSRSRWTPMDSMLRLSVHLPKQSYLKDAETPRAVTADKLWTSGQSLRGNAQD